MNIRVFSSLSLVAGLAVSVQALKADFPPAPDLAAPPILSEAKVWLDAWDYSTVQTDDDGFVTNWLSKGDAAYNAKTYANAVLGKMGVTNGVPAFLMGDTGSGIDLAFKYMTDIRTVFWVMDTIPYEKSKASDPEYTSKLDRTRFLGCSMYEETASFARGSGNQGMFYWYAPAFYARAWIGDTYLWTWDQRRWCWRDCAAATHGTQVYAISSDIDLRADRLSASRGQDGAGPTKENGGRALSELIIFNRTLSNDEVLMVKSYLNAKYKGLAPVTVNAMTTPAAVIGYDGLMLGANASFVLTDAVLGNEKAAPVNVWGDFDKTAAGKIRLAYRGHVYNRRQALFCVGKGGLTLEDFELAGFPEDAEFTCDGRTLWMRRFNPILSCPLLSDTSANGPKLWLDASEADSFVTNETGGVLVWKDRSPNGNDATNYVFAGKWTYPTVGTTANGVPALQMGKGGSGMDLAFNVMTDIRTVFWAMDIEQSKYASFLGFYTNGWTALPPVEGDNYVEQKRQAYMRSQNGRTVNDVTRSGFFMFCAPTQVYEGQMLEDGVLPKDTGLSGDTELRWISPHSGLHVFSHRVKDDVGAWANNLGRCMAHGNSTLYTGGKDLSELVIFNRSLTDDEVAAVTMQLRAKWQGTSTVTKFVKETTIDAPCYYATLVMDRESTGYQVQTEASVVLKASALTDGKPAITAYSDFRRGEIAKCVFTWAGDAIPPGDYTILACANVFNCEPGDFVFNGFPDNAYLYWRGSSLKMTVAGGCEPLVPSALSATGEAAPWLWLDAADATTFTTNEQGGVLAWADRGARGNDATAYQIGDDPAYGTVGVTNGVTAYLMGNCGSRIDLAFPRTTAARTMFWVMDIEMTRGSETGFDADFLGDASAQNFFRGGTGQYSGYAAAQKGWTEGVILEDGDIPHDKKSYPDYKNFQFKPYAPPAVHVYSLQAGADMAASCLSARPGDAALKCSGGRALSELVVFNRALTAVEFNDVEAYLDTKWKNKMVMLAETVDATVRVSYPNLNLDAGAGFTVNARALKEGGEAAVTVYGQLTKLHDGRIRIENASGKVHKGGVLLRCAASVGVDLDSFELVGFPEGTTFVWENNELKVADCLVPGLLMIVR